MNGNPETSTGATASFFATTGICVDPPLSAAPVGAHESEPWTGAQGGRERFFDYALRAGG